MSATDPKLIAALLAAKAALESALLALTEQPNEQPADVPVQPAAPTNCNHEHREDQRTFGVTEAWRCLDCGFEYRR